MGKRLQTRQRREESLRGERQCGQGDAAGAGTTGREAGMTYEAGLGVRRGCESVSRNCDGSCEQCEGCWWSSGDDKSEVGWLITERHGLHFSQ